LFFNFFHFLVFISSFPFPNVPSCLDFFVCHNFLSPALWFWFSLWCALAGYPKSYYVSVPLCSSFFIFWCRR
jgi:hypothetical protein